MKYMINIAVVCLARKTFDYHAAEEIYRTIQDNLTKIPDVKWNFFSDLIIDVLDAQKTVQQLLSEEIDGIIVINGTFALGNLVLELNKRLKKPILLWGLNELPYDSKGKIRLNSICGVNLNASNLYKAGIRNYYTIFGEEYNELNNWLDAIRINKSLSTAHIGFIGSHSPGFFNLDVDELDLYRELGVLIDHYDLQDIFRFPAPEVKIKERKKEISKDFDISALSSDQLDKLSELTVKFDLFIEKYNLAAIAIHCWPEFAKHYGISPCASMSILQSEGKILACEGDILGSLSMLAQQAIGGRTPFLADISQVDFKEKFALLWHCGVAPACLWDEKCVRSLDTYFAEGKGITTGFVMKSGDLSLLRIDYSANEYRIFLQKAKGIPMEKELKGTYVKAKFESEIRSILSKIIDNGIAHHFSVVYGDFIKPFEIFSRMKGWKIIK